MRVEAQRRGTQREGGMPGWLPPALIGGIVGLVLGLIYAWGINPVTITNATPGDLAPTPRQMWVAMVADYYAETGDEAETSRRLGLNLSEDQQFFTSQQLATDLGAQIEEAQEAEDQQQVQRLRQLASLAGVEPVAPGEAPQQEAASPGFSIANLLFYCGLFGILLVVVAGLAVARTRMQQRKTGVRSRPRVAASRNRASVGTPATSFKEELDEVAVEEEEPVVVMPREEGADGAGAGAGAAAGVVEEDLDRLFDETADEVEEVGAGEQEDVREIDFAEPEEAAPEYSPALDEFVTRYNYGDDGYDMSFSIETPQTEFLGECGVGISDVVNEGTPQQATAFEVWLFDKDDIRTVTKVLLSEYAWNNEELRSRLAPKGELVLAREGDELFLETKSLRVCARVREVEYGEGGPDNSAYFERLVVELTPQQKQT